MTPEAFMAEYERRTNTHDVESVAELISSEAVYWFNDGSFAGLEQVKEALHNTWQVIQNETYSVRNIRWLVKTLDSAVCLYEFKWSGLIDGQKRSGWGRGTTVLNRIAGAWKVVHEHLSTPQTGLPQREA